MPTRARVIGIGEPSRGDDGVGLAVLGELRARGAPPGTELIEARDPSALVNLLVGIPLAILVDAVAGGGPPGSVLILHPEDLEGAGVRPLSSHGIGVPGAIDLARTLFPEHAARRIEVVGIAIPFPAPPAAGTGLSPDVARAVPAAAEQVLSLLGTPGGE
ncbi:MAG: hydrogenase maturation protease [Planctomycetes bacterium]|nr:hydrogenase maturation protease [Planctomycetota bacterium]